MVEALLVEAPDFSLGKRHASSKGLLALVSRLERKKETQLAASLVVKINLFSCEVSSS